MHKEEIMAIAAKVSDGSASKAEMIFYIRHIDAFILNYPEWENLGSEAKLSIENVMRADIENQIFGNAVADKIPVKFLLWPKLIAAAIIIVILSIGLLYFNRSDVPVKPTNYVQDIVPGKEGARLTLSSGKTIVLSEANNGELTKESGVTITKADNGQLVYQVHDEKAVKASGTNTLTTAKGEQYQVTLPDGTKVWLNTDTKLSYPSSFIHENTRKVELAGEAYFEVAKDKAHPFIVQSLGQQVEVLGTHFNINCYPEEKEIKTTLLEGHVRVNNKLRLEPGEQSVLTGMKLLKSKDVNIEDELAWRSGKFSFEHKTFKQVMNELARWYDLEIVYEGPVPEGGFFGRANRNHKLPLVLGLLESAEVEYRVTADRKLIIINKEGKKP